MDDPALRMASLIDKLIQKLEDKLDEEAEDSDY
jgi:frataxin-like iron-binding protein CyaY